VLLLILGFAALFGALMLGGESCPSGEVENGYCLH
jgi:hypothetical protein